MTDETTPDAPRPETFAEWVRTNQSRLLSNVLYFHYDEGLDAIAVTDQGGFILQQSDFEQLVSEIYAWYDAASEDFIERHNQARFEKVHGPERSVPKAAMPSPPKPHRMLPGEVYVVRADNGLYKIGRSSNVAARIKTLTVHSPMRSTSSTSSLRKTRSDWSGSCTHTLPRSVSAASGSNYPRRMSRGSSSIQSLIHEISS